MLRTFNCVVGMIAVDTKEEAQGLAKNWKQLGFYTEIKEVAE